MADITQYLDPLVLESGRILYHLPAAYQLERLRALDYQLSNLTVNSLHMTIDATEGGGEGGECPGSRPFSEIICQCWSNRYRNTYIKYLLMLVRL